MSKVIDFSHWAMKLSKDRPLVYTAMSRHLFYFRMFISKFVLETGGVPLNPFMVFDYFLADSVDRDTVREANNNLVKRCDELWVFGPVSDGVLAEIQIARKQSKPVKYFSVQKTQKIIEVETSDVQLENDASDMRHLL